MSPIQFPRVLLMNDEMSSTQDAARDLVERDGVDTVGVVIGTAYQTAGRGRQGRTWHAPRGANLINTFVGSPVPLRDLWQTAFVAGLAAADAVATLDLTVPVRLRFPNDVLLDGKKVCGVLVETAAGPTVAAEMPLPLVGIGINVRGSVDALPPEVAVRATTLEAVGEREISVGMVGSALCETLTARWNQWQGAEGFGAILAAWKKYQDTDVRRNFEIDGETVPCRVLDVTEDGNAVIELPNGDRRTIPVPQILLS